MQPLSLWTTCFNPLPSQKQGETRVEHIDLIHVLVSIRSPHKSKGRLYAAPISDIAVRVSIRSPHKSKGRLN